MTTAWDPPCPMRSAMFALHASKILRAMCLEDMASWSRSNMHSRIFAVPEASLPAVNVAGLTVQPSQLLIAPLAGSFLTSVQSGLLLRSPGIGLQHWPASNGIHVATCPWHVETHPTLPKWVQHGSHLYESPAVYLEFNYKKMQLQHGLRNLQCVQSFRKVCHRHAPWGEATEILFFSAKTK